jgi:hypothetical protein
MTTALAMVAAFDDGKELHIIRWTGRVRLHAGVTTYCKQEGDASEGVLQVPAAVFSESRTFTVSPGQKRTPCAGCRTAVQATLG